jgi:hypothetical protein
MPAFEAVPSPRPAPRGQMKGLPTAARRAARAAALLCVALALGCHRGQDRTGALTGSEYDRIVRLTVQNNDFKDCDIYLNWQGYGRRRIGMVVGKTSQTFTFEWVSDVVTIEGDFVAGNTFSADPINVQGGDHLDLVILNQG